MPLQDLPPELLHHIISYAHDAEVLRHTGVVDEVAALQWGHLDLLSEEGIIDRGEAAAAKLALQRHLVSEKRFHAAEIARCCAKTLRPELREAPADRWGAWEDLPAGAPPLWQTAW